MKTKASLIIAAALAVTGCTGSAGITETSAPTRAALPPIPALQLAETPVENSPTPTPTPTPGPDADPAEAAAARIYLSQLAPQLVRRELEAAELTQLKKYGKTAIPVILEAWAQSPALAGAARGLIEDKLSVSGTRDGIDFNLPGNLAAHIVRENLPWKTVLTADYCVDAAGAKVVCDSGAPYTAGVLTTRAFLVSRASRFNLTRASTMLKAFACRDYPMESTLQPPLAKEVLIPMFAASTPAEQTDPRAAQGFGNGNGCYMCHSQFGAHSQLFVKFDTAGQYKAQADGIQDPAGELGRSVGGLMTSHMKDPLEAKSEKSQMFGVNVDNLRDAAWVLANNPVFTSCQVRNLIEYATGIHSTTHVSPKVLGEINDAATVKGTIQPTFGALVFHTFSHPRVIAAVTDGAGGTP